MAVLVDETALSELGEHLVHMAGAEGAVEILARTPDGILDRESLVAVGELGDDGQQTPLPVGDAVSSAREEVFVKPAHRLLDCDRGIGSLRGLTLQVGVEHRTA